MSRTKPRVYIARVDDYDGDAIQAAVERGLDHLGVRLRGNVTAKANWVFAHDRVSPAACTRPELVHGALDALFEREPEMYVLFCGNSGLGVATRRMARAARGHDPLFRRKGYYALPKLHRGRVGIRPTDETRYHRYQLSIGRPMTPEERQTQDVDTIPPEARYWERVVTGWEFMHADSVVFFPKLKTSVLTQGFSGAIKDQGIGLLRDVDRLDGHNRHNDRRIVDLLEVTDPDLVITDAIEIGVGGNQITQSAHRLGVVVVADNAVAHDAVCARILGLDPQRIDHIRIASERGYGPLDPDEIDLRTEVPLETLQLRARGFGPHGLMRVDRFGEFFERVTGYPFPLDIRCGPPHEAAGSAGILLDWLYAAWDDPDRREKMKAWPPASVLVGEVGEIPSHPRVFLVGDRAIAAFRKRFTFKTTVRLPASIQKVFGGVAAVHRYKLDGGRTGWAVEIPGEPPGHRDLFLGLFLGSLGRLRTAVMRLDVVIETYVFGTLTVLRRRRLNRDGIPVVHARKIARLERRAWRLLHGPPSRLALRPPPPPLPAPPVHVAPPAEEP